MNGTLPKYKFYLQKAEIIMKRIKIIVEKKQTKKRRIVCL